MNKDFSVTLYRVVATIFILLCHLGTHYQSGIIAEGFKVGVQMFLLMSGYLVAKSAHKNRNFNYLLKRFIRILLPVWCFVIPYMIISWTLNFNSPLNFFPFIFGVFGINMLSGQTVFNAVAGISHLWYITAALICELIALPVLLINKKRNGNNLFCNLCFLITIIVIIICLGIFELRVDYILVFVFGLLFHNLLDNEKSFVQIFILNVCLVLSLLVRLFLQSKIDTTTAYENIINPIIYLIMSAVLFLDVKFIVHHSPDRFLSLLKKNRLIKFIETFSFEIYITHYILIDGPLNVFLLPIPETIKIFCFLIGTAILSTFLHYLVVLISKSPKRKESEAIQK